MWFRHPLLTLTWPAPNYVDPELRPPYIYPINSLFFAAATIAVGLRLYTRVAIRRWFGPDDVFIIIAWFCALCDITTQFFAYSHYDWDRHMYDGHLQNLTPGSKALMAAKAFWATASAGIRVSVLFLYYRLLNHIGLNQYRWVVHATMFLVVSIWISYFFTTIFACYPVWAYWIWPSPGFCIDEGLADTILSSFNTASEALVATLPIPIIFWLDLNQLQRRSVACLLCLGYLVTIVGAIRTWYIWTLFDTDDMTWWAAPYWVCSETEICVAMICACAPSLRPLFGRLLARRKVFLDTLTLRRSSSRGSHSGSTAVSAEEVGQGPYSTYSTYWKTIDVEGIGIDGLGYTVTITADGSKKLQKSPSKLRRLFKQENDLEKGKMGSASSLSSTPTTLVNRMHQWSHRAPFSRHMRRPSQVIEITATRRIDVVEEVMTEQPMDISSTRDSSIMEPEPAILATAQSMRITPIIQSPVLATTPKSPIIQPPAIARGISPQVRARIVKRSMSPLNPSNASAPPIGRSNGTQSMVSRSLSPEMQIYQERSISPLFQQQLPAKSFSPVIQAPVARRISPEFIDTIMSERERPQTFYCESDDGNSFVDS